jgi:hypothetical protein
MLAIQNVVSPMWGWQRESSHCTQEGGGNKCEGNGREGEINAREMGERGEPEKWD